MAKIERFDAINQQLLSVVDAQILEVNNAMNALAGMLLDSISELSYDNAYFVIDEVEQYLNQIPGDEENKRRIVRCYASLIVADIRKQIYEHMDRKTQDVYIIQKDLILFRKFVRSVKEDGKVKYDKPFSNKSNIKKYLFTGYKKSYYPANSAEAIMFQVELKAYAKDGSLVFIAEHICRKILAPDEFYFEQRPIMGRGRGCAAVYSISPVSPSP